MDAIRAESQAGVTRQFTSKYVSRMVQGLAVLARCPGMDDVYDQLMWVFVSDFQRALQGGQPSAQIMDANLTVFSDNPDAMPHLSAAIDAAVDFKLLSVTACYNLCLLRAYFDAVGGDEPRNVIYFNRFIPRRVSDYPAAWQTAHDYYAPLVLRLGLAEEVIRANPCRHTLDSQLWDEADAARFMDDWERPEAEADGVSVEILRYMKREHDTTIVKSLMKSGVAKNIYQAIALAQYARDRKTLILPSVAAYWRGQNGYVGRGGIVVLEPARHEVAGWSNELRNPEHWIPGCIAVNEDGECWEAKGGDDQHGAVVWVPVPPSRQ